MQILWPETLVREQIEEIRTAIGRNIQINITVSGVGCPICSLDPITNTSVNSYCPVCHGLYWLETTSGILVSGHVRWFSSEKPYLQPGGQLPEGDCQVTIAYTDANLSAVEHAQDFIVDAKRMTLKSYKLKGVKTPNRIAIVMLEEGKDNG